MEEFQSQNLNNTISEEWRVRRINYDLNFEQRVRDFVELEMRRRGDPAGRFSPKTGEWREGVRSAVVSFPIIGRAMRSNTATSVQTQIQLNFSSSTQDPAKRNGTEVFKALYKFAYNRYWTEDFETEHADLGQLGGFTYVLLEPDTENQHKVGAKYNLKKSLSVKNRQVIACANCGQNYHPQELGLKNANKNDITSYSSDIAGAISDSGVSDDEILKSYQPNYELPEEQICLKCQKAGVLQSLNDEEIEFEHIPGELEHVYASELKQTLRPSLLTRFDTVGAIGFKYKKANFVNTHYPVAKNVLKARFPEFSAEIENFMPSQWSYGFKWYYELGKPNLNRTASGGETDERQWIAELDETYFKPEFFVAPPAKERQVLMIGSKIVLTIEVGQTFAQAAEKKTGKKFDGLVCYFLQDDLIGIEFKNPVARTVLIPWRINATCAIPNGEERLLHLQNQVTNILSQRYQIVVRAANAPLVYNSKVFEKNELNRNQPGMSIGTKDTIDEAVNPSTAAGYLQPPTENNSDMNFIQFMIDVSKEESGVYDETVGATDPTNKTLGGQRLSVNRSLALLSSTQKSKKLGLKEWITIVGEIWQEFPDEAFTLLAGINEDGITPQDIEDFKSLDLRREVLITEVTGSDVPKSTPDMLNLYQIAVSWGLFTEANGLPLNLRQTIVRDVLGLPIDLQNYESDRRLAAKRVEIIKEIIAQKEEEFEQGFMADAYESAMMQMQQGIPPDQIQPPMPKEVITLGRNRFGKACQVLHPEVLTAIDMNPQTGVSEHDAHIVLIEYYDNQLKALQVSRELNAPLILALQAQIDQHNNIANIVAMQEMAKQQIMSGAANAAGNPSLDPGTGAPPLQIGDGKQPGNQPPA